MKQIVLALLLLGALCGMSHAGACPRESVVYIGGQGGPSYTVNAYGKGSKFLHLLICIIYTVFTITSSVESDFFFCL